MPDTTHSPAVKETREFKELLLENLVLRKQLADVELKEVLKSIASLQQELYPEEYAKALARSKAGPDPA